MADLKQAEAEYLAGNREARIAAERMDERLKALPTKLRLAIYKAAHAGDDLVKLVDAAEAPCGRFNCLDEENCCTHCGAHFAEPHHPACKHADEPVDECEGAPADGEPEEPEGPPVVAVSSWDGGTVRFAGTPEGVQEYVATNVAWRYRESTAKALLRWIADGCWSPHRAAAWHGETETWWVDATATA